MFWKVKKKKEKACAYGVILFDPMKYITHEERRLENEKKINMNNEMKGSLCHIK